MALIGGISGSEARVRRARKSLMIAGGLLTKGQVQAFEMAVDIGLRLGPGSTVIIAGLIHASLDKGEQGIALRLLKAGLLLNPVDEHLTSLGHSLRCIR